MSGQRVVERKILDLIAEDELLTTSEIARKMKMRRDVAAGFLEALEDQGKVRKMQVGRSHVYKPLENDDQTRIARDSRSINTTRSQK